MAIETPAPPRVYTADDLLAMPSEDRYELFRGELIPMSPPPGALHGSVTSRLASRIAVFVDDNDLGECFTAETGFLLERDPDTVLAPDFAFVAKDRMPEALPERGYIAVVPDLVVETRSPSDTAREAQLKADLWFALGAKVVWEIDPRTRVLTERRRGAPIRTVTVEETLSAEDLLPGFSLPMRRLFRGVPHDVTSEAAERSSQ
jgi:Uma2 family endonuclease